MTSTNRQIVNITRHRLEEIHAAIDDLIARGYKQTSAIISNESESKQFNARHDRKKGHNQEYSHHLHRVKYMVRMERGGEV